MNRIRLIKEALIKSGVMTVIEGDVVVALVEQASIGFDAKLPEDFAEMEVRFALSGLVKEQED